MSGVQVFVPSHYKLQAKPSISALTMRYMMVVWPSLHLTGIIAISVLTRLLLNCSAKVHSQGHQTYLGPASRNEQRVVSDQECSRTSNSYCCSPARTGVNMKTRLKVQEKKMQPPTDWIVDTKVSLVVHRILRGKVMLSQPLSAILCPLGLSPINPATRRSYRPQ